MNAEQKDQIRQLHSSGLGYKKIAAQLGLSVNTVASFCKRQSGITMLYRGTANNNSSALSAKSRFLPIPVRTENIVPVFAMGSTERKWHMEKEHYHKIITYQTTVSILKSWMRAGLVTPEEFQKINTIIAERSGISLCSIFLDSCPIVR